MRVRGFAAISFATAAIAMACDGFGESDTPPVPDGGDAVAAEAGSSNDIRWVVHNAANTGPPGTFAGLAAGPNDTLVGGTAFSGASSFGGSEVPATELAAFSLDATGRVIAQAPVAVPSGVVTSVALDSAGAIYLAGSRFESVPDGAGSQVTTSVGIIAKFDPTGARQWMWEATPTVQMKNYASQIASVATRGTDVVIAVDYVGAIRYGGERDAGRPLLPPAATTSGYDVTIMLLDGATGEPSWMKTLGGPATQFASSVLIEANGDVLVGGVTNSEYFEIDGARRRPSARRTIRGKRHRGRRRSLRRGWQRGLGPRRRRWQQRGRTGRGHDQR